MIDLSLLDVIDEHCHPFFEETRKLDLEQLASSTDILGVFNPSFLIPSEVLKKYEKCSENERTFIDRKYHVAATTRIMRMHSENTMLYRSILYQLSCFLGCKKDPIEIVNARNRRSADYRKYLEELFTDARVVTLLVDDGYSELAVEHALPHLDLDDFKKYVPVRVARVTRIEPLMQNCLDTATEFSTFISLLMDRLHTAKRDWGCVSFKSLIAYRSGLDIGDPTETQAKKDFRRYKETKDRKLKALRDYVLRRVLEKCIDLDVPLQLHTGLGDVDILVDKCNPAHLFSLLKDDELRHAKVVLVHCGYPYISDAAYLANVLPNVYLDVSVLVPYATVNISTRLHEVLELAPFSKMMYASDATQIPEMHWLAAKMAKTSLSRVLGEMIDAGVLDEDEANDVAELILSRNAAALYRL